MKVRFDRHELADALAAVGSVVANRTPKPILECVLIQAAADHCVLLATDLEIGVRFTVAQIEVSEPGQMVVPADKLTQIVRESADETLTVELDDSVCHIRGEGAHFQIYTQDAAEFPPVSELTGAPDFEIEMDKLRSMAEWTVFAAARENTRYAINGILWEKDKKALTLVATDGRRLSLAREKIQDKGKESLECIVPAKTMHLVQRVLGDAEATVAVKVTGSQIIVRSSRATLTSGLVEGQFPKYRDVVPSDCNRTVRIGTADLLSAVRRAALLTNEESRGVRFAFSSDALTLSSRAPSQGEATITLPIQFAGEALDIGFNPQFLIDALKVVADDEVTVALKEPNRPGLLKRSDDYQYVIMPVSLS